MSLEGWKHIEGKKEDVINGDVIAIMWGVADVYGRADDLGVEVDNETARMVLKRLYCHHNSTNGITWKMINEQILKVLSDKEDLAQLEVAQETAKKILELKKIHGKYGQHPSVSRSDWKVDVASGKSQLGYWETVVKLMDDVEGQINSKKSD